MDLSGNRVASDDVTLATPEKGRPVKDVTLSADGVTIHFEIEGEGAPGPVFVHGWSWDRTYWSRQVPYFAEQHQVVSIDLAGDGESALDRQA